MATNAGQHLTFGHKLTSDSIMKLSVSGNSIRNNFKPHMGRSFRSKVGTPNVVNFRHFVSTGSMMPTQCYRSFGSAAKVQCSQVEQTSNRNACICVQ